MMTVLLWLFVATLGALVWRRHGGAALAGGLREAGRRALNVLPRILMVVLVAGFTLQLMPGRLVADTIGPDSGFTGVLFAMLVGGMIPAGASVSFSVVVLLNEAGAGVVQLVTLLTAWSVFALHRVIAYEIPLMGPRFAALRLLSSLPLPLVAGGLTALVTAFLPWG